MPERFADLSTPLIADACVRLGVPPRTAPAGIRAVVPSHRLAGRVLPVRHHGSVDVFLEAYAGATPGDVLVIDNGGRTDEACVGGLAVLEGPRPASPASWCGAAPAARGRRDRGVTARDRARRFGPGCGGDSPRGSASGSASVRR
ncbi:hypothetical protein ACGF5C_12085 [Micromonospora sp. NPDC047620]|uniref:RraA family protein n=1 Tax=Micromonospora sp. NPDC047620 TaxID=3364251 RepID=UPI00371588DB